MSVAPESLLGGGGGGAGNWKLPSPQAAQSIVRIKKYRSFLDAFKTLFQLLGQAAELN